MGKAVHEITWDFLPAPGKEAEFLRAYGETGPWPELFRRAPGYLGTELQPTPDRPGWFRTVDRWTSPETHAAFRVNFREAYEVLDRACAALTADERRMEAAAP